MTEQEFRDALKKSVDHAGLSSERQMKVLAQMKGENKTVKVSNQMKIALVLTVMLMLSIGVAVAAEIVGFVNWQGQAVNVQLHKPNDQQRAMLERMQEAAAAGELTRVAVVNLNASEQGDVSVTDSGSLVECISDPQKMAEKVQADSILPWPGNIPEGWVLSNCIAEYACAGHGDYQVTEQAPTVDGLQVYYMTIPEQHRLLKRYSMSVLTPDHIVIDIRVGADTAERMSSVKVDEGSEVSTLSVDGMKDALFIVSADEARLVMRKMLDLPVSTKEISIFGTHQVRYEEMLDSCKIEIIAKAPGVTANDLLVLFGLTAK